MGVLVAGASHIDTVAVAELLATRHQVDNLPNNRQTTGRCLAPSSS